MSIYQKFCKETIDENGALKSIELDYPENFNFGYDVVDVIAGETPDKKAMVWCNTENEEHIFTFSDIKKYSDKMANVFKDAGIEKGDRVMVILKRHYEYWFAAIALHKIGAVMIPATHMLTVSDFVYRFRAAKVKAVICTTQDEVPQKIDTALSDAGMSVIKWCVQKDTEGYMNLTEATRKADENFQRVQTKADDPMILYFTSGTTGYPKGVIHDYTYPLAHIVTAKYWHRAEDGGLHFTVAETGWAKASWGKLYGQWLVGSAVMVFDFDNFDPQIVAKFKNTYSNKYLNKYLSLMYETDQDVASLLSELSQSDRKTIVVFWGDHQPNDYVVRPIYKEYGLDFDNQTYEQQQQRQKTPFFIWANYDIQEQTNVEISLNYLNILLFETAGLQLDEYQTFRKNLWQGQIPMMNAVGYRNDDGDLVEYDDAPEEIQNLLNEYQNIQYYRMEREYSKKK